MVNGEVVNGEKVTYAHSQLHHSPLHHFTAHHLTVHHFTTSRQQPRRCRADARRELRVRGPVVRAVVCA